MCRIMIKDDERESFTFEQHRLQTNEEMDEEYSTIK